MQLVAHLKQRPPSRASVVNSVRGATPVGIVRSKALWTSGLNGALACAMRAVMGSPCCTSMASSLVCYEK
jgi:hypothetical protein